MNSPPGLDEEGWGLSSRKQREMRAELEDHLMCSQSRPGHSASPGNTAARTEGGEPSLSELEAFFGRRLGAPHALDQVAQKVLALPRRIGCRGLALATGGGLVLASLCAAPGLASALRYVLSGAGFGLLAGGACLMLQRAWLIGPGVALARLLQVNLVLGISLAAAGLALLAAPASSNGAAPAVLAGWPVWAAGPALLLPLAAVTAIFLLVRRSAAIALAAGSLAVGLAMYPGLPWPASTARWTSQQTYPASILAGFRQSASGLTSIELNAAGQLEVTTLLPHTGTLHVLGSAAPDATNLLAKHRVAQSPIPGEIKLGAPVVLLPDGGTRLIGQGLALLAFCGTGISVCCLCVLLSAYPSPGGGKALAVLLCTGAVACLPIWHACAVTAGLASPTGAGQAFLDLLLPTARTAGWWTAAVVGGPLAALLFMRLAVPGAPRESARMSGPWPAE